MTSSQRGVIANIWMHKTLVQNAVKSSAVLKLNITHTNGRSLTKDVQPQITANKINLLQIKKQKLFNLIKT